MAGWLRGPDVLLANGRSRNLKEGDSLLNTLTHTHFLHTHTHSHTHTFYTHTHTRARTHTHTHTGTDTERDRMSYVRGMAGFWAHK